MGELYVLWIAAATAAKSLQSCPTPCDPIDGSPPGSLVPGILQARTLEWVAISFSNAWNWKVKVKSLSGVRLLATPWTVAPQAPLSMGFSRQEYWSGGITSLYTWISLSLNTVKGITFRNFSHRKTSPCSRTPLMKQKQRQKSGARVISCEANMNLNHGLAVWLCLVKVFSGPLTW